jgi:general secretion pathway protein K
MMRAAPAPSSPARDDGFALVAAVAGTAVFAYFAFQILDASRGTLALIQAQQDKAVLAAAVDAGFAQTIYGVALEDRIKRLPVDGIPRILVFNGVRLTIIVADERGKIAINKASPDIERSLFAAAGASSDRLNILVNSLEDWKDENDTPRPDGAEATYYRPYGIRPRNGAIRTVDELGLIRGMDDALLEKLAPAITLYPGNSGEFNADTAPPLVLEAMKGAGGSFFDIQARQQELAGERTALDTADDKPITGRSLSVDVLGQLPDGSSYARSEIVEFNGNPLDPYWVRSVR